MVFKDMSIFDRQKTLHETVCTVHVHVQCTLYGAPCTSGVGTVHNIGFENAYALKMLLLLRENQKYGIIRRYERGKDAYGYLGKREV